MLLSTTARALRGVLAPGIRRFSNESILKNKEANVGYEPEEIHMDMPWGKIAGQAWGSGNVPVLALHGYLDNCLSFDRLFRLLPLDKFRIVVLDLPGHGYSDHIPPGMNYTMTDGVVLIHRAQDHLGWARCQLLGHSMGAAIAAIFTACFPERVERVAMLDLLGFSSFPLKQHCRKTRKAIELGMKYQNLLTMSHANPGKVPKYEWEDAVARAFLANTLIHGEDSITRDSVELLMKRSLKRIGQDPKTNKDLYTWRADLRVRIPSVFNLVADQADHYASQIEVPHMIVKASDSPLYMSEGAAERVCSVYRNNNSDFVWKEVQGGHHVHLNDPEGSGVAAHVEEFMLKRFKNRGSEDKEPAPFKF